MNELCLRLKVVRKYDFTFKIQIMQVLTTLKCNSCYKLLFSSITENALLALTDI